jgi:dipeptidyl-peptidase-4
VPAQVGRTRRFALGVPRDFSIAGAGTTVLFLRERSGDDPTTCLWAIDLAGSGGEWLVADPGELTEVAGGAGIGGLAVDAEGELAVFALAGGVWVVEVPEGKARRLPVAEPAVEARPDPTGRRVAYVRGGELRVIGVDGTGDRAVATPEGPDVTYGVAEDAGAVVIGGAPPYCWAPDGERLMVARIDCAGVAWWQLANPAEPTEEPRSVRYAAVGQANAEVGLWLVGADGGERVEVGWEHRPFEYLVNAGWDGHGPYVAVQSRDQRTVRFLVVGPDGATTVAEEWRDQRWVQPVTGLPART